MASLLKPFDSTFLCPLCHKRVAPLELLLRIQTRGFFAAAGHELPADACPVCLGRHGVCLWGHGPKTADVI